jgi:NAD(P)-dependent dehydrogenase (short-subunit alcohol dehydrogenase family)
MKKVLLVTGGSRGIGAQTALLAAAQGWTVAVNYAHNERAAQEVVNQILAQKGHALAIQADLMDPLQIESLFERVDQELGTLSGLVNNAGIVDQSQRVDEYSHERLTRMMNMNVVAPFLCAKEAVKRMSQAHGGKGGVIVNVSSVAARLGGASQYVDYAASKAALDALTIGLSKEVARENIRVNSVSPGLIDTEIHASGGLPNRIRDLSPQLPFGRAGTATEVAQAICWLLSESASYCSGTILDVSGAR